MKYNLFSGQNQGQKIILLIFGLLLFSLTSTLDTNYFIRNYLLFIEIKTILLLWLYYHQQKSKKQKY